MKLYMSEGGIWVVLLLYTPIALFVLWCLWKAVPGKRAIRIGATSIATILAALFPFWDVLSTSNQMARLCPAAGVRVYKAVEVEGYLTNFGGEGDVLRGQMNYLEEQTRPNKISIYTKQENKLVEQIVDPTKMPYVIKSRYEYRYGSAEQLEGAKNIAKARSVVVDRISGEILGEAVSYTAFPGWIDRNSIQLLGNFSWHCPENSGISTDLLRQTLRPIHR